MDISKSRRHFLRVLFVCIFFTVMMYKIVQDKIRPVAIISQRPNLKWRRCQRLIPGNQTVRQTHVKRTELEVLKKYMNPKQDCKAILKAYFLHPPPTKEEINFPITYGITIFKGASLFERLLRAIYMPQNVYCIHIDKKSSDLFYMSIYAIIRCLPNAFIAQNRVDVVWGHISLVRAQMECMKELLNSPVKWKYYISLIGQDFPLYENKEIVLALKKLNNTNNMESFLPPKMNEKRTKKVWELVGHHLEMTSDDKTPPPHNIIIYKGSTHIIATRGFVNFTLHSTIGKDFTEFLKDSAIPDEIIYASLQQLPQAPGGIHGKQPELITRALRWDGPNSKCYGRWKRDLCWLSVKDLRWALGSEMRNFLFVHKIPFDFSEEMLECLLLARQGRKYGEDVWKTLEVSRTSTQG